MLRTVFVMFMRVAALIFLGVCLALPVCAVEFTLYTTNVVMPAGRTFQMPVSASDSSGEPLKFSIVSINSKKLSGAFSSTNNPSLLLNVSGVDATNGPFTGNLVLQLFADLTPQTTANIITLVKNNFYNGLSFHRIIQDFMAQGGDPLGDGTGGTGVQFDDEFVATLTFTGFGQLAMANSGRDSNDSQFFITDVDLSVTNSTKSSPQWLDFRHTIFGQLTRGFDVMTQIMETPVNPFTSKPITPVVINSASIMDDTQTTVLRLSADSSFTGKVSIIIRVVAPDGTSDDQTISVTVVPNGYDAPPFLGPIPTSLTVTQNVGGGFPLSVTDLENDSLTFSLVDSETASTPTNLYISYIPTAHYQGQLWLYADPTVAGIQNLVLGVNDLQHFYYSPDSQRFALTIVAADTTPTMNIVPQSGTIKLVPNITGGHTNITPAVTNVTGCVTNIVDSTTNITDCVTNITAAVTNITGAVTNKFNDSISISGDLVFFAQSDKTFGSNDVLRLSIGPTNNLVNLSLYPDFYGWRVKSGVVTWKSLSNSTPPPYISSVWGTNISASVKLDSVKGKFKVQIKKFDFPSTVLTNPVQVSITVGNDSGSDLRPWREKNPGIFIAP